MGCSPKAYADSAHRVHAFCLTSNHVHLALQAGDESLSRGLQNLAFRYTRHVNTARKRVGHLFEGRYTAFLVDQDRYGLELVRYIHLNPVRAGMVAEAAAYPWSGHRTYLSQEVLAWLTTDWVLGQFGATAGVARRRYARCMLPRIAHRHGCASVPASIRLQPRPGRRCMFLHAPLGVAHGGSGKGPSNTSVRQSSP